MDLSVWIADYETYLHATGYHNRTIASRLKHLRCLQRFVQDQGLGTLEEFAPQHVGDFIDYWVRYQPWGKTSSGFKRKSRYEPHHHIAVHYSLHCFFRWAYSTGRLQRNIFPRRPPVRGNYGFAEAANYLRFCSEHKGLAENSLLQIELFVRRFDQFLRLQQITEWNQIQSCHIDIFVQQQSGKNIKRIQRIHKVLRGLFRFLFSLGLLDRDWSSALISPRQYRLARVPRAIGSEQVLRLLAGIDREQRGGRRDFAMILMAASLGVRASEIAGLHLEDLDWRQGVVRFRQIKNRKVLLLPLSRPLVDALICYLEKERPANNAQRAVFMRLNPPWEPLNPSSVSDAMRRRVRQAGIAGSGHQLRHSFASELLRVGVNYSTLQELLGHSHISSTQIYTKIDLVQLRDVAENDAEDY